MNLIKLQTRPDGDIVTMPLTGFGSKTIAQTLGLLVLQYAPNEEALENEDKRQQVQIVLAPQQIAGLVAELTTLGKELLALSVPPGAHN